MERVKSADVLDPNHEASRPFRGRVVGHFERTGPNSWDDYRFVRGSIDCVQSTAGEGSEGDEVHAASSLSVLPGVPLQLESRGTEIRMRSQGRVVRVCWVAEPSDIAAMGADVRARSIRRYFIEHYLVPLEPTAGLGATAVMVRKLNA